MPINPKYPFELVHSVDEAEAPTDGRAVLIPVETTVEEMLEMAERIRPFFIDPPDMTEEMERKRSARIQNLARVEAARINSHDPEVAR